MRGRLANFWSFSLRLQSGYCKNGNGVELPAGPGIGLAHTTPVVEVQPLSAYELVA